MYVAKTDNSGALTKCQIPPDRQTFDRYFSDYVEPGLGRFRLHVASAGSKNILLPFSMNFSSEEQNMICAFSFYTYM